MSTTETTVKPARRRRRTTSKPQQWPMGPCGRPTPPAPAFIPIVMADGSKVWVSSRALARSGCVHCLFDSLSAHGYLRVNKGLPLEALCDMVGDGQQTEYGPLSGLELVSIFTRLCMPPGLLSISVHDDGGTA